MKFATVLASSAFLLVANAQSYTINTPAGGTTCQPLLISWSGGQQPWILSLVAGSDPNGAALEELGTFSNVNQFTWKVNVAEGSYGLKLLDATGLAAQTAPFNVAKGSDTSCIGKPVSSSSAAPGGTNSTAVPGSTNTTSVVVSTSSSVAPTTSAAPTTSSTPATTSRATTSAPGSTTSAPASTTSSSNAAPTMALHAGLLAGAAAVLALVV